MEKIYTYIKTMLIGLSRVMFQDSPVTGLLFLIGIFYNSWLMGIGALIGVLIATATGFILGYKKQDIYNGYYGFNGVLVGIALLFFFEFSILILGFIIIGAAISSIIMNFMHERGLEPYAFPFVLSTWFLMLIINLFELIAQIPQELLQSTTFDIVSSITMGSGQVMFQENIITGIIFLVAVFISSRKSGIYAILGSIVGMLFAFLLSFPLNLINIGIFGFNGVLCSIAFENKKLYFTIISILLSVLVTYALIELNIVTLTFPFVLSSWLTLGVIKILSKN